MHQYIKAIGFSEITTNQSETKLLNKIIDQYTSEKNQSGYIELNQSCGQDIGIAIYGEWKSEIGFIKEYYVPYAKSKVVSSHADIIVEKKKEKEAYMGVCEDIRIGVNLVFYIQNPLDYMKARDNDLLGKKGTSVNLMGLSLSGMILLPIEKTSAAKAAIEEENNNRMMLINAARDGDTTAMESLTLEDMETYSKISKRIIREDVFTIIETYIMPYGVESDEYSVMGEIKELREIENKLTKEIIYSMDISVNNIMIGICIPKSKLLGEPCVGRRFKGTIWMQGYINFPE